MRIVAKCGRSIAVALVVSLGASVMNADVLQFQPGVGGYAYGSVMDTYLESPSPTTPRNLPTVQLRSLTPPTGEYRNGLIQFNDISIPVNHQIDTVTLDLLVTTVVKNTGSVLKVWDAATAWNESATWSSPFNDTSEWGDDGAQNVADRGSVELVELDISDLTPGVLSINLDPGLVKSWIDSPGLNHGLLLTLEGDSGITFYAKNHSVLGERPKLTIVTSPIPEPGSLVLLGGGALALIGAGKRRGQASVTAITKEVA